MGRTMAQNPYKQSKRPLFYMPVGSGRAEVPGSRVQGCGISAVASNWGIACTKSMVASALWKLPKGPYVHHNSETP